MNFGGNKLFLAVGLASLASGCADLKLARFAPPGIIKYEDIASEAPPNPAIQQQLDENPPRKDAEFPVIAQTPSKPPNGRPKEQQQVLSDRLTTARDELETNLAADRAAAETERTTAETLDERRERLEREIERDARAAARERAGEKPAAPDQDGEK